MRLFPERRCCPWKAGVFFANAEHIGQKIRVLLQQSKPKVVVCDFSNVPDLEYPL